MQLSLSSNNWHLITILSELSWMCIEISLMRFVMGITSLRQVDSAELSASVDESAFLYWNLLRHIIGVLMQDITCPVRENSLLASLGFSFIHALSKYESACANSPAYMCVLAWVHACLAPIMYLTTIFFTFSWVSMGHSQSLVHWCSAMVMPVLLRVPSNWSFQFLN